MAILCGDNSDIILKKKNSYKFLSEADQLLVWGFYRIYFLLWHKIGILIYFF